MLGDHVEDDDDERASRPAHLDARTAKRRKEEPGDDGRDQSLVRGRAARDRQSHGEGEGDDRDRQPRNAVPPQPIERISLAENRYQLRRERGQPRIIWLHFRPAVRQPDRRASMARASADFPLRYRSEEHTSELQSLMSNSY